MTMTTGPGVDNSDGPGSQHIDDGVPYDRGWSWVICFSVFAITLLQFGHDQAIFVLFVDFEEEFQQPASVLTFMFTIYSLTSACSALVTSNVLMMRFSARQITCGAAFFGSIFTLLLSMAPNVATLFVVFGLKGMCFGALLVSPTSLLSYYFKKRRAFATAVSNTGLCAAFILFPSFTQILRSRFGLRGALLVLSAVEFHSIALGMLLRPVETYRKLHSRKQRQSLSHNERKKEPALLSQTPNCEVEEVDQYAESDSKESKAILSTDQDHLHVEEPDSADYPLKSSIDQPDLDDPALTSCPDLGASNTTNCDLGASDNSYMYDTPNRDPLGDGYHCIHRTKQVQASTKRDSSEIPCGRNMPKEGSNGVSPLKGSRATNLRVKENNKVKECENIKTKDAESGRDCCKGIIDLSLLKIWPFRMILVANGLGTFTSYVNMYMPTMAVKTGLTRGQAVSLLTVVGVMDLCSRIILGCVADSGVIAKTKIVAVCLACISLLCHLSRFYTSYTHFLVYAACVGLTCGCRHNLLNVILIDHLSVDGLAKGLGMCSLLNTLLLAANHPVIGVLLDETGSFVVPMHFIGTVVFIACLLYLAEPLFMYWEKIRIIKDKKCPDDVSV